MTAVQRLRPGPLDGPAGRPASTAIGAVTVGGFVLCRISLFSVLTAGTGFVPVLDPPNSLNPGPKGKVRFEHEHQRAILCTVVRQGKESSCRADRQPADSATQLRLHPIPPRRITVKDRRQTVELVFSSQVGRQDKTLELGTGDWELEWPGYDKRPRFRVRPGDEFEIPLRTLSGSCKRTRDECVLETGTSAKECSVPDAQRAKP